MLAYTARWVLLVAVFFAAAAQAAESVLATARQADGKIVVAAAPQNPDPTAPARFLVGRLNADGNIDTAFGEQGWATVVTDAPYAIFTPTAIAIASSGRIVVAFQRDDTVGLAALTSTGARDVAFGGGGMFIDWDSAGYRVNAIVITESSPFLTNGQDYVMAAGGYRGAASGDHWDTVLLRYNLQGFKDITFGTNGAVRIPLASGDNEARALVATPFSSMFLAGYAKTPTGNRNFLVARVNMNGLLESAFGAGGKLVVDYMGQDDEAFGIALNNQTTRLFVMGRVGQLEGAGVRGLFGVMAFTYDGAPILSSMLQATDVALEASGDADATALAYVPLQAGTDEYLIGGTARNLATGKSRMVVVRCSMFGLCGNPLWGTNGLGTSVLAAPPGDSDEMRGMYLSDAHQSAVVVGTRTSGTNLSMMRGEFSTGTGLLLTDYTMALPDTTITSGPASPSTSRLAAFTVTSDNATTFKCALDSQPFDYCTYFAYEALADGEHVFRVRAYNYAGDDPTPSTWTWTVDATAPDTTIWAKPAGAVASSSVTFEFSSNEAGATFECSVDGAAYAACSPPVALSGLAQGSHSFEVRARDAAGNADASPDGASWVVDTLVPDTIITNVDPPQQQVGTTTTVAVSFASSEGPPLFECSLDMQPFAACTSPMTYTGLWQGAHIFRVRARDLAGNVDATPAERHWTVVDATPPTSHIVAGPSQQTSATFATFAFTSDDWTTVFQCSLDSASFAACTSPVTYTGLAEGAHTFSVRAIDPAGNVEPDPAVITWYVDWTAPETLVTSGPPESTNSTSAAFTFSAAEAATFECSLDGSPFAPCSGPGFASYTGLSPGPHRFSVRGRDLASNLDTTPSDFLWEIDVTPPQTALTSPPPAGNSTTATLSFTSNEPAATFFCRVDVNRTPIAPWSPCVSPFVLTGLAPGLHVFEVVAMDAAGNVDASSANVVWTVASNATAPIDTSITVGPSGIHASSTATFMFTASVPNAPFECRLSSAPFQPCTSPKTYSGVPNGSTQTFSVRARHPQNGQLDATPASSTWTVDLAAPVTTISFGPPSLTPQTSALFAFSARIGSTFECRLDGDAFTACTSPISYSSLTRTQHQFQVRATDATGRVGPTATRNWTVY